MPWSGELFREKHAKHLSGHAAQEAASMANAMLKSGVPEGEAIATAIAHGNKLMGREPMSKADKRYRRAHG